MSISYIFLLLVVPGLFLSGLFGLDNVYPGRFCLVRIAYLIGLCVVVREFSILVKYIGLAPPAERSAE